MWAGFVQAVTEYQDVDAREAEKLLRGVGGLEYRLIGRLRGGESGAHEFAAPDGRRVVIKWDARPGGAAVRGEAVILAERLRTEAAWPVPTQSVIDVQGVRFIVQEYMPGLTPRRFGHQLVDELLDLHERRRGLARPGDPNRWPADLIETLTVGGQGYCLHSSLREHSSRTRALVERIEAFGKSVGPGDLSGADDIVHWDLHAGNLLVDCDSLSAVVDTDFATVGDAHFDLVTLAVSSLGLPCDHGVRERLFASAIDDLDEVRAQAYLAHLFLRIIDWPIRRSRHEEVELWLDRADELLTI